MLYVIFKYVAKVSKFQNKHKHKSNFLCFMTIYICHNQKWLQSQNNISNYKHWRDFQVWS